MGIRQRRNLYQMRALRASVLRVADKIISVTLVWKRDKKKSILSLEMLCNGSFFRSSTIPQKISVSIELYFLMKIFFSEILHLFADSANSGFSIHGNSMAYSSLMYSSGIAQFINHYISFSSLEIFLYKKVESLCFTQQPCHSLGRIS